VYLMEDSWRKNEIFEPIYVDNKKASDDIKILERTINDIHRILYTMS
jgi:hypothetical protein